MSGTLASKRSVINVDEGPWEPYTLPDIPAMDCSWCNLSWDEKNGEGSFLIRFAPGARSIPHEHVGYEEFLILEGSIEDHDGAIYKKGDFVSLKPGSRHWSKMPEGATVAVFIRGGFRVLDSDAEVGT